MKKTFILLSSALISLSATAQNAKTITYKEAKKDIAKAERKNTSGFVLNAGISLGASDVTAEGLENDATNQIISISPAVNIGYMLNPHVGFFTGLSFSSYGFKSDFYDDFGNPIKGTFTNRYLEIPVFVRVITSKANKVGFIADLGISTGFLTGAKLKVSANGQSEKGDVKELMTNTAISTLVFLGVKIPVSPMVNIMAGFDSQYSLTAMFDGDDDEKLYRGGLKVSAAIKLTNNK